MTGLLIRVWRAPQPEFVQFNTVPEIESVSYIQRSVGASDDVCKTKGIALRRIRFTHLLRAFAASIKELFSLLHIGGLWPAMSKRATRTRRMEAGGIEPPSA